MNPPPPPSTPTPKPPMMPPPPPSIALRSILRLPASAGGKEEGSGSREEDDKRTPLPDGTELGDYTISSRLGQGGFGITYRAMHRFSGEQVVIKEHMPAGLAVREPGSHFISAPTPQLEEHFQATLDEFIEEVTTLMALENPGVVRIRSAFEANGTAYYVMPFVPGRSLAEVARVSLDRTQRAKEARSIKQELAVMLSTLEYLGQNNVVHRDIKPENILITPDGRPILLDFGSARQRRQGKVFTNVYTPDLCAPEQSTATSDEQMSEAIGPWTDIYALGATAYYVITRMLPPRSELRALAGTDPYTPLASRPDLCELYGKPFLSAIDRALALDPKERWQEAGSWRRSIEQGILPPTIAKQRRTRIAMATAFTGLVILGGVTLWALKERSQAMEMYRNSLGFTENVLYDFYDDLADIPGSTQLQRQLSHHLSEYLGTIEKMPVGDDEKVKRATVVVLLDIARVNIELGDLETATKAHKRATELEAQLCRAYPDNMRYRYDLARTWLSRAEVERRRNRNDNGRKFVHDAIDLLKELREASPDNPDYACTMGEALGYWSHIEALAGKYDNQKKALDEMLALYRGLQEKYPERVSVRRGLGYALQLQADFAAEQNAYDKGMEYLVECRELFNQLVRENPYKLSVREGLARAIHQTGELYFRMGETSADPALRSKCDDLAMEAFERHLSLASKLETLDSSNATYPMNAGQALASMVDIQLRRGQVNQAEATAGTLMRKMDKLLETAPDNADYLQLKAAAWRGLATAHSRASRAAGRAMGEFEHSRQLLEELLKNAPDNVRLRWSYARTLAEMADHQKRLNNPAGHDYWHKLAEEQLRQIVRLAPGSKLYAARFENLCKGHHDEDKEAAGDGQESPAPAAETPAEPHEPTEAPDEPETPEPLDAE